MTKIKVNYYEFVTPPDPNVEVVSLDVIKQNARIEHNDEDSIIQVYRDSAIERIEDLTNQLLRPSTIRVNAPYEEYTRLERYSIIELQRAPIRAVDSVAVWNGDAFTPLDAEDYIIEEKAAYWRIQLYPFKNFSAYPVDVAYPLQAQFQAGYLQGQVPNKIKLAIIQYATWLYENRGDCSDENLPEGLQRLIGQCRVLRTFA